MALRIKSRLRLGRKGFRRGVAKLRDRAGKFAYIGGKKRKASPGQMRQRLDRLANPGMSPGGVGMKAFKRKRGTRLRDAASAATGFANNTRNRVMASKFVTRAKGLGLGATRAFTRKTTRRYGKYYGSAYGAAKYYAKRIGSIQISKNTANLIKGGIAVTGVGVGYFGAKEIKRRLGYEDK